ncbi:Uu.00g011400.m01.CDS01 [Anthostomella pinea]|uniref:Uu.00g011400.m01.CDS01 n=1 Tax=Anthostomella pinea TaxID=933095 RepID=A0AAI8VXR5_9PEZI|nr:Uu.00g011400.m01.CDS01 [Anthostomella pinea]
MESPLMYVPAEVRLMIYEHLFNDDGNQYLSIRTATANKLPQTATRTRSRYYVLDRSPHRRCHKTTYHLATKTVRFCAALMQANRTIHEETSCLLYGGHAFDFGVDIEAIQPFLSDLTSASRALVSAVSLTKRGPAVPLYCESDRADWRTACRFLRDHCGASIHKLRLVVQGERPSGPSDGPAEFSADDLRLLAGIRHESLEWVGELAALRGLRELEVVADVRACPAPVTSDMVVFAAFSASIEKGLTEFLRERLGLLS